jgi:hypothetical protein
VGLDPLPVEHIRPSAASRLAQGCSLGATFTRWEDRSPRRFLRAGDLDHDSHPIRARSALGSIPLGTGMLPRGHLHPMGRSLATPPLRSRRNPCSVAKGAGAALSGIAAGRGTLTRAILNPYEGPDRRDSSLRGTQASLGGQASVSCAEGRRVRRCCLGRSSIHVKIDRATYLGEGRTPRSVERRASAALGGIAAWHWVPPSEPPSTDGKSPPLRSRWKPCSAAKGRSRDRPECHRCLQKRHWTPEKNGFPGRYLSLKAAGRFPPLH